MKKILVWTLIIFSLALLFLVFVPEHYDPPPERMASMEMIVCSAELRLQIEESLIGSAQIPQSPKNECEWTISKLSVSSSGSIELFNQKYGIHIEFQPIVNDSEVQWVCKGKPEKYVPVNCRENT